jgi:hypothetical protein
MRSSQRIVLETGVAGGLLFTIHVSIPNCGAWPFIWPAFAGATAVWLATREPQLHRWRAGLVVALVTGVITGAIAFVGVSTVVYTVVHTGIAPALRQSAAFPSGVPASAIAAITMGPAAALAAVDIIVGFLSGALALPARYFQTRHAQA